MRSRTEQKESSRKEFLKKTSVQLKPSDMKEARKRYPTLTTSEFLRLAVEYTIRTGPKFTPRVSERFE
jgi:hypothetical protein